MGGSLSRKFRTWLKRKHRRCLLVGLDAAGKSTVLYALHTGASVKTVATVGFNVETIKLSGLTLNIWVSSKTSQSMGWQNVFRFPHTLLLVQLHVCAIALLSSHNNPGCWGAGPFAPLLAALLYGDSRCYICCG